MIKILPTSSTIAALLLTVTNIAAAADKPYSPYVGRDFPQNVYFGDTHLHTNISLDSYGDGNRNIGPDGAYRFAKGEERSRVMTACPFAFRARLIS